MRVCVCMYEYIYKCSYFWESVRPQTHPLTNAATHSHTPSIFSCHGSELFYTAAQKTSPHLSRSFC